MQLITTQTPDVQVSCLVIKHLLSALEMMGKAVIDVAVILLLLTAMTELIAQAASLLIQMKRKIRDQKRLTESDDDLIKLDKEEAELMTV